MKKATKLRLLGGLVLLFNLWLIGQYNLEGISVLLLTFGFAVGYELLVVRPISKVGARQGPNDSPSSAATEEHGMRTTSPTPILPKRGGSTAPIASEQRTVVDEDPIYTAIAKELETGVADKGLWTRLFAECGGDEKQTKVLYIKQRADRFISAERLHLEQAARERAAETERVEKLRPPPSDAQQMEEYCISFDGERYTYGEYKYDRLADAISYAKLQNKRPIHRST